MNDTVISFAFPVDTTGLAGFPSGLADVSQARRVVEAARLPVVRSHPAWLDAFNRLTAAHVSRGPSKIEEARLALCRAVDIERRDRAALDMARRWAAAA